MLQEEDEYEDIAVAESQDIAHRQFYPNSDDATNHPRSRPRGRKRRRRLRKRPRSTTPSFIEEYDPDRAVKEEEEVIPPVEEEVPYQRRRPAKRRRRPMRRKPEFETEVANPEVALVVDPELQQGNPPEEYYRPRNTPRRRRKGGRKRMRVTTELSYDSNNNNTNEESLDEVTTQQPEVVMQSNDNSQDETVSSEVSSSSSLDQTTDSIFTKAFTPKEITEINHELESLSRLPSESEYQVSGLGAFSGFRPTVADPTTHKSEEIHIETTTKEYSWITRFDPQSGGKLSNEVTTQGVGFGDKEEKKENKEPKRNIKNIERIIENRKHLFSTSKRLPPTSAVIRRRLRPQKQKNVITTQETIIDNTIPTVNPSNLKFGKKECKSIECTHNRTRVLSNNIIPSSLIPSGFPTMPEVLSTAELLQKTTNRVNIKEINTLPYSETNDVDNQNHASSNVIIITPSTLIRSQSNEENVLIKEYNSEEGQLIHSHEPHNGNTNVQTITSNLTKEGTQTMENSTASLIETKMTEKTAKTEATTESKSFIKDVQSDETPEEETPSKRRESERLRLDGVDVSNINDEILEFIMDEMGKARVKRILELRNMTLSELIAHRERGAGHFSAFNNQNLFQNKTKNDNNTKVLVAEIPENTDSAQDSLDQENTEKMIVEKAKLFLNEFKKPEENISRDAEITLRESQPVSSNPVSTIEPAQSPIIQFPEDGILGAFPKYMYDIAGKKSKANTPKPNEKPSLFRDSINRPREIQQLNDKREPRVFESMPQFSSETSNKDSLEIFPYPDWRIGVSKSTTEKTSGFPGISKEIMIVATSRSTSRSENLEEVILLDEGEEVHHLRNHILGGKINVDSDEDYPETKKVPASVKSAIAASGALLGLAIFGFLAVLVSCKIRQRRARLRARRDILCEHLAEDFRCSQRSRTPVLRKSPFNNGIHSNTASNRHYYLWRTLRKTFQYE